MGSGASVGLAGLLWVVGAFPGSPFVVFLFACGLVFDFALGCFCVFSFAFA